MAILTAENTKQIKTLNNIAEKGLRVFNKDGYTIDESSNPDAIIVRSQNMHDMKFDEKLKAIARAGAGVNNIPIDRLTEKGIVVFNTPGANANSVKEIVLTTIMASSRNIFLGIQWVNDNLKGKGEDIGELVEKGKKQFVGREVKGKKLGVIGLGAIGAMVANDAVDLEMDVIGFDPYISIDAAWDLSRKVERAMSIEEVLETADYITIHVPLTEETKDMLDKDEFDKMKDGVHIFNYSRGGLINEDAVEEALNSGKVGKYITDFPTERILKMKNAFATPHLGASTKESEENCAVMAASQVKDYLETGNIKNSVNFPTAVLPYNGKIRFTVIHKNVPNLLGKLNGIISERKLNIAAMINRSRGDYAYTIIDIDEKVDDDVLSEIEAAIDEIEDVVRIRII